MNEPSRDSSAAATPAVISTDEALLIAGRRAETSLLGSIWRRFRRHKMAMVGAVIMLLLALIIAAAPLTARYSPTKQDLRNRLQPPSAEHWMGTDELGRDLWARVVYGGRVSLSVGLLAMLVSITLGTTIGLVSGFYGKWVDNSLMRVTEVFLTFPRLFVLILLTTLLRKANLPGMRPGTFAPIAFVIGILAWMTVARLVRATTLELRNREFVTAATSVGAKNGRIMAQHILPNVASPIIVAATLGLAAAIIAESGLSYLGFGVQPPTPTWGNLLRNAQSQMMVAPWTAIFPGLMIFVVVLAVNFLGEGLRDALDPRHVQK
jgi:peptide/nickel transport system permease protein